MLVLWDHRSERSLTREPRGPGWAGGLRSSINALDGDFPPRRWQVVFSGLQFFSLLCFVCYAVPVSHILGVPPLEF